MRRAAPAGDKQQSDELSSEQHDCHALDDALAHGGPASDPVAIDIALPVKKVTRKKRKAGPTNALPVAAK